MYFLQMDMHGQSKSTVLTITVIKINRSSLRRFKGQNTQGVLFDVHC